MRELKFRFWDGKSMYTDDPLCPGFEIFVDTDVLDIMQYTGLKDKKGEEIYEGDIIRFTNEEADHKPTAIIWNDEDMQFQTQEHATLTDSEFTWQGKAENIEVIGNIYEDPELLKSDRR